jgi:tetratricopeptide (TPR) repeat protein
MCTAVGRWHQAAAELTEAAEGFRRIGSRTERARALSVRAFVSFHAGQLQEAHALWSEVDTIGSEDDLVRAWAATGQAKASVRIGRYAEAISILGSNQRLVDEVGELPTRLAHRGFSALALWHEGRLEPAVESAKAGLEAIEGTEAFAAPHAFDGVAEIARVLLSANDLTRSEASGALAERSVRSLEKVARRLPIARPRASMARAILLAGQGKRASARRRFRRALQQADSMAMPYEHGLILREMGHATGDSEALARSAAELAAMGAVEDVRPVGFDQPRG